MEVVRLFRRCSHAYAQEPTCHHASFLNRAMRKVRDKAGGFNRVSPKPGLCTIHVLLRNGGISLFARISA